MYKKIVLMLAMAFSMFHSKAQNSISGSVVSDEGESLYGATIKIENSLKGSVTDLEGRFELRNISSGTIVLKVSYIGFEDFYDTLSLSSSVSDLKIVLQKDVILADELIVTGTRVRADAPVSHTNLDQEKIEELNIGRDVPYIINQSPSVVSTSDAGGGIGYTALRIRGIDQTNINVTINGIALNDAEGHGVYWVDLPDFSSSLSDIQIQRGVGTSTNGAGAFGSTINMQTEKLRKEPYAEFHLGAGSFNTFRGTVKFGTGLMNKYWSVDGRLSRIESDGYIDRAHSHLTSYYLSGGFNNGKTSVKLVGFGGHENTYQAWNGIDRETMKTDRTFNSAGAIYDENWKVINFYDNQVDNYDQDHLQLLINHEFSKRLVLNLAGHYTYGRGYYESYRQDANSGDYGIRPWVGDTIQDLIDRQWLDNHYYGMTYNLRYQKGLLIVDFGGGINRYDGDHFGEVIWAQRTGNSNIRDEYYRNKGVKDDFNSYLKASYSIFEKVTLFADIQSRTIDYSGDGTDPDVGEFEFQDNLNFVNPKFGLNYFLNNKNQFYYSVAVANREPNRNDYFNAPNFEAKPENLIDHELGHRYRFANNHIQTNLYFMDYNDQLVLTGEINNVGEPLRSNVGKSYRAGIEISAEVFLTKNLKWLPNMTFSKNTNVDYKYINESAELVTENTPLAYSPEVILNNTIQYQFFDHFFASLYNYYIGEQYLNNTGQDYAKLDAYHFHDFRLEFRKPLKSIRSLGIYVNVNNVLDAEYVSNGYLWGTTQYVFPQAGRNYMLGLNVKF